jgi:arsenate reductase
VTGRSERVVIFHNPSCSKSRGALELLRAAGVDPEIVQYLKQPPSRAELERIIGMLGDPPAALVRHDKRFRELGLDPAAYTGKAEVIDLLVEHPELMERPVVVRGERAVIGRPPEKVLDLL